MQQAQIRPRADSDWDDLCRLCGRSGELMLRWPWVSTRLPPALCWLMSTRPQRVALP